MRVVLPVPEAREVAVGSAFAGVFRSRLTVHLQYAGSRSAQHPTNQVEIVDLYGGRGRLMGLVETLQDGGQQPLGVPDYLGGPPDSFCGHAADVGHPLRRVFSDATAKFVEADGVRVDVAVVDPIVSDHLVQQSIHQRHVGSRHRRQMHGGSARDRRRPRIDADDLRRVGSGEPVKDSTPQHGLRLSDVVAEQRDHIGVIDVGVGAGLAVTGERLFQRRGRRRGAQPGVAVEVIGAQAGASNHGQGVVLLEKKLAAGIKANRCRPEIVEQ